MFSDDTVAAEVVRLIDGGDRRPVVVITAEVVSNDCSADELAAFRVMTAVARINKHLRERIEEEHLQFDPRAQLVLDFGQMIPPLIEPSDGVFVHRLNATVEQVQEHNGRQVKIHARRHGIAERIEHRFLERADEQEWSPTDVIGKLLYGDRKCPICRRPLYDPDDPFVEYAHDKPISGRSGSDKGALVHRSCNRSEGAK